MLFKESETLELKEIVTDDIKKEIIAFANCNGGKLFIGVKDDGTTIGVDNPDEASLKISNMVRDAIKPDLTMFLHYETLEENGKQIVSVEVQRGTARPYYLAKKGMRPEGVYVRQGYSSVPATDAAIRHMIKDSDGDSFETMRSLNQELTFGSIENEFNLQKLELGIQQMRSLKMIDNNNFYTNLALLLSEQCTHTTKVAVFQGIDKTTFKDRKEFSGSLIKQIKEIYSFIDFKNQTHSTFEKLYRIDIKDYPETAIRETLLNLLVHRDYSFRSSAFINIYDDRIEFISIGGLMPGIELEDIMLGISVCRNEYLANVFYRLNLIEAYGTGIGKILKAYKGTNKKPSIETSKNAFKITLPNVNSQQEEPEYFMLQERTNTYKKKTEEKRDEREEKVFEYVKEHGTISRTDVMNLLDVSVATSSRLLSTMTDNKILRRDGKARRTRYTLAEEIN